jgi:hypothetical protein
MESLKIIPAETVSNESQEGIEWPKVPQSSFGNPVQNEQSLEWRIREGIETPLVERDERPKHAEQQLIASALRPTSHQRSPVISTEAASSKPDTSQRRWFALGRFALPKSQWPNPELSIGTRCNRMGINECWEAIGPAQELFAQISQEIADLLDKRVDELMEGEPVTKILTFGMYMIGRTSTVAQPTLVVTCERQKPRRRAIKFIKESSILKGHPKIAFAESSIPPPRYRQDLSYDYCRK